MLTRRRFLLTAATAPALSLYAQEPAAKPEAAPAKADIPLPASLQDLKDRRREITPIPVEEREERLDLARALLKQYSLDALLLTGGPSLKYFTGLDWQTSGQQNDRFFAWVLPQQAAPFLIAPQLDNEWLNDSIMQPRASDGQLESILPERKTTNFYLWQENEDPFVTFQRVLAEFNLNSATLGVDEHTPFGFVSGIGHASPGVKLVSATPVTAGCRSVKSDAEIALLRLSSHIAFDVFKAAYLAIQPGDSTRRFEELIQLGYERSGVQGIATCQSGADGANPLPARKPRPIREGELIVLSGGCQVDGYWSSITRSFLYGKPTDAQRSLFEIVHNAQSTALAACGPGVPMQTPDSTARQIFRDAKYGAGYEFFTHRLGHGVGLDPSEWPYLVQGNQQKMMTGMVFANGPGLYVRDKYGLRLEDELVVTDKGAELFLWQSPSLQDPFAIPAVLPGKSSDKDAPADTKPSDTKPEDKPETKPEAKPDAKPATPPSR